MALKLRGMIAAVLLFLVIAIDFTGKMMSMLADGVLVIAVIAVMWPVFKGAKNVN
ncbi:TciB-like inhibition of cell division or resistance to colicin [Salmonella phage FSL SP-058]|uniref:DUF3927 domain-containing protein n=1 Tax=Salmonella phage FSL SP-058 TaxID=1173761 RepID=S4TR91_9CAUD|nr:TciB-like inhibition of cell division or resistance to colicin [Salmonella phage FSL SP-058]AGF88148.1 hypothetical protein SP058_00165 [Salmonella phage FSL SP-058]ECQ2932885.1 DUF3927 domain-containing protein [Salmonella enterica]UUG68374.1 hypothetical protein B2_gp90 [Shigella phage B2]WDR22536.1 hypothetical protein PJM40_0037 [Salmonella phage vB_SenP_UTK0002]